MPVFKVKDGKYACSSSRGISLRSVVGKLFGRVLIKKIRAGTECSIGKSNRHLWNLKGL